MRKGQKISEATREKMRIAARIRMAKPRSEGTTAKWRASRAGYVTSEATRLKLSAAGMGRVTSEATREKMKIAARRNALIRMANPRVISASTRAKLREIGLKRTFSSVTRERIRQSELGKPRSKEAIASMQLAQRRRWAKIPSRRRSDDENYDLRDNIEAIWEYKDWRQKVFLRDNFTCQGCSVTGTYLNAHHIKRLHDIVTQYGITNVAQARNCYPLWSLDNGVTLCPVCHKKVHSARKVD